MKAFEGSMGRPFPLQAAVPLPLPPPPSASIDLSVPFGHAQRAFHQHSPLTTGERSLNISKIYVMNNLREIKKTPKLSLNCVMGALKDVSILPYQIKLVFCVFFFCARRLKWKCKLLSPFISLTNDSRRDSFLTLQEIRACSNGPSFHLLYVLFKQAVHRTPSPAFKAFESQASANSSLDCILTRAKEN